MHLTFETELRNAGDIIEAMHACGLRLAGCKSKNCPIPGIVEKNISRAMAGKSITIPAIVEEIFKGCAMHSDGSQCEYANSLKERLLRSSNAYISTDGSKYWPDPTSDRSENRKSRLQLYGDDISSLNLPSREENTVGVVTMGSCFMNEINKCLVRDGFLLQIEEEDCLTHHNFPVAWGTVFNPLSAKRSLAYYMGIDQRPSLVWSSDHSGEPLFYDPFREDVVFRSLEAYERNSFFHRNAAKAVLESCDVLVAAFSMIETWICCDETRFPLARAPWRLNPLCAEPYVLSYHESLEALHGIMSTVKTANPDCKIILGVDPVPLHATHTHSSAIIADSRAKAILVAATQEAINTTEYSNVHYLPSYEIIHYCTDWPWAEDERHLSQEPTERVYAHLVKLMHC